MFGYTEKYIEQTAHCAVQWQLKTIPSYNNDELVVDVMMLVKSEVVEEGKEQRKRRTSG